MVSAPNPPTGSTGAPIEGVTAGLGRDARTVTGGVEWSRVGALLGSTAAWARLARRSVGVSIAFVVNCFAPDTNGFLDDAIAALGRVIGGVRAWPANDLFSGSAATLAA